MGSLVEACSPYLRPIVVTAINTGMRKSEIPGLKWQDIDFGVKTIPVHRTNNNEPRVIQMNQTLYDALHQFPRRLLTPYVFCHENGERYDEVKRSFRSTCRKAGITDCRFHDLRHTFASHLVMNGINLKTVQYLLGHKDIRMTFRYAHVSGEHLQAAVRTLDAGLKVGTKREQGTNL